MRLKGLAAAAVYLLAMSTSLSARAADVCNVDMLETASQPLAPQVAYDTLWAKRYDVELNPMVKSTLDTERSLLDVLIPLLPNKTRALDVATGTGKMLPYLESSFREVVGVDLSIEMLKLAQAKIDPRKTQLVHSDLRSFETQKKFDLITFALGLKYFSDLDAVAAKLAGLLEPGGRLVLIDTADTLLKEGGGPRILNADGSITWVEHRLHVADAIAEAFAGTGLTIRNRHYAPFTPASLALDASFASLRGKPAVMVFVFEKGL